MKIPLIWLRDYLDTNASTAGIAASFTSLGLMLDKPVGTDNVLDLEHRMDRADWLSIVGCARDLAAFDGLKLHLPKVLLKTKKAKPAIPITVTTHTVRRFNTRVIRGITVAPSPKWLRDRLVAYGIESINNIVDATNFVMVEYGQPLHAQDIAKLPAPEITIRKAEAGETITTLLGTAVKLDTDTDVLASGGKPIVITGIVGGRETGVTKNTHDIVLDAGNYDSRVIRKTSRRLKIANESSSRNDKFLDPRLTEVAIARTAALILELAGGECYDNVDWYPRPVTPQTQILRASRLKQMSGLDISLAGAKKTLKALDYQIVEETDESLTVEIPYFRTDIEVEDDLVADILRIRDYANIPAAPLTTPVPRDVTPAIYTFEEKVRDILVATGGEEHITDPLVKATGRAGEITLANSLSADQNALRVSLEPSLQNILTNYGKHARKHAIVFEVGKVYRRDGKKYVEKRVVTVAGTDALADSLATILRELGISEYLILPSGEILIGKHSVGMYRRQSYTLQTESLLPLTNAYEGIVSTFANVTDRDISLLAPSTCTYYDIHTALSALAGHWSKIRVKSVTKLDDKTINYLLTLVWGSDDKHVRADVARVLTTLHEKLGITSKS